MKTFAIGDIHGNVNSLKECIEKSKIDVENDTLIVMGDVVDGFPNTCECVEELLKFKNCIFIRGNHDQWFLDWTKTGFEPSIWTTQGGFATIHSYNLDFKNVPKTHKKFFEESIIYYIDNLNRLFVHGGIPNYNGTFKNIGDEDPFKLMWDRSIIEYAIKKSIPNYSHIFVGHTSTGFYGDYTPKTYHNLTMLDTGGGWNGRLTIMDVDTFEYWQSKKRNQSAYHYLKI